MNNTIVWINLASNAVLTGAFSAFLIFLFGRDNSLVYRMQGYHTLFLRVGLCACAAGSLLNVLTLSSPPVTEVILNAGLAMVMLWAAVFHYLRFVRAARPVVRPAAKTARKKIAK